MERKNKIVTKKRTVSTAGKKIAKPKTYSGFANKAIRSGIGKKVTSTKKIKKTNKNKTNNNKLKQIPNKKQFGNQNNLAQSQNSFGNSFGQS